MMSDTADLPVPPPPSGYISKEAKDWYFLLVIVLSIAAFLLAIILPFAVMIYSQFSMVERMQSPPVLHVDDAVVWQGKVWMVREPTTRYGAAPYGRSPSAAALVSWDLAQEDSPTEAASLAMVHPRPLADGDRLWLISRDHVTSYQAGASPAPPATAYLTDPTRPFLCDGRPAVIDMLSEGPTLRQLKDQQWEDVASLSLDLPPGPTARADDLRVIPAGGVYYVLARVGDSLYCRTGLGRPGERVGDWEKVAAAPGVWAAAPSGDRPIMLFYEGVPANPTNVLVGMRREKDGWRRFSSSSVPNTMESTVVMSPSAGLQYGSALGVFPATDTEFQALVSFDFLGATAIMVNGDTATRRQVSLGQMVLPPKFMIISLLTNGLPALVALLVAVLFSILVARYRVRVFDAGGVIAAYAPLWRRGVAAIIDLVIAVAPVAVGYGFFLTRMMDFIGTAGGGSPFSRSAFKPAIVLLGGGAIWALGLFFIYCFTEGRWGVTLGKWLLGIRVRRADLQPCGFLRALVRNLLRIVDGFLCYLVGLMVAAMTDQFQRLGDLAAGTVVVSARAWPQPPEYVSPDPPSSHP